MLPLRSWNILKWPEIEMTGSREKEWSVVWQSLSKNVLNGNEYCMERNQKSVAWISVQGLKSASRNSTVLECQTENVRLEVLEEPTILPNSAASATQSESLQSSPQKAQHQQEVNESSCIFFRA